MERIERALSLVGRQNIGIGLGRSIQIFSLSGETVTRVKACCTRPGENFSTLTNRAVVLRVMAAITQTLPFRCATPGTTARINLRAWSLVCLEIAHESFRYRRATCPSGGSRCDNGYECMKHHLEHFWCHRPEFLHEDQAEDQLSKLRNWRDENHEEFVKLASAMNRRCKEFDQTRLAG